MNRPALILCGMGLAFSAPSAAGAPPAAAPAPATPPVDVVVAEASPPRRVFALEWNPVALFIDRISATIEIAPVDHHVLVLSPYYFNTRTASFPGVSDGAPVAHLSQRFEGVGGEIGYRYYAGYGGPRGFFAGPSFILAGLKATDGAGSETSLMDYGIALDVGWQALVADDWVIGLGGGAQYSFTSKSVPDQQAPAAYYANAGVHPRALAALGYAF
jgi:hypothetical protein